MDLAEVISYTLKPNPFDKQFCMANTAIFTSYCILLFKVLRKYFSQGIRDFIKFLFVLLGKIKILTLKAVYFPHELLHLLFLTPFRNLLDMFGLIVENNH
jgi:hypothetical protein